MRTGRVVRSCVAFSAAISLAMAAGCGEEELGPSDTETKDGSFWSEASNEQKNEMVGFCRRKEERQNTKLRAVSTSALRDGLDEHYDTKANESQTVQEACAEIASGLVPDIQLRTSATETVNAPRATIDGTVDPSEGVRVTVEDERGRTYEPVVADTGDFEADVELPGKGEFTYTVTATSERANDASDRVTVLFRKTEAELAAERRRAAEAERQRREAERLRREQERQQRIAGNTLSFSGSGSKSIGTVHVKQESILEWSNNDDPTFRQMLIYDDDFGISISSGAVSGDSVVPPGTYRNITVAGGTSWTITIRPR